MKFQSWWIYVDSLILAFAAEVLFYLVDFNSDCRKVHIDSFFTYPPLNWKSTFHCQKFRKCKKIKVIHIPIMPKTVFCYLGSSFMNYICTVSL